MNTNLIEAAADLAAEEAIRARQEHGDYASLHEAWAVLYEEVDELWEIVRQKKSARRADLIVVEALQIAGIALRIAADADSFVEPAPEPKEDGK